jgi:hypothetical protein
MQHQHLALVGAALLLCAAAPPDAFQQEKVTLSPRVQELKSSVTVQLFIQRLGQHGTWEQDADDGGWIYRIEGQDRLTRTPTSTAILLVDLADGYVWLSRWNVNGEELDAQQRAMLAFRYLRPPGQE